MSRKPQPLSASELCSGPDALRTARADDVVIARFDVLPTLDGVEPGLLAVLLLERRGIRVVNGVEALLAAHDKLRSAAVFKAAGLPHPETTLIVANEPAPLLRTPCVVKPGFGGWGRDVFRCASDDILATCLAQVHERPWFRRHGALIQELLPATRHDLRVLVAGGRVVGAAERVAAAGEWRTNLSLGGSLYSVVPPDAAELARTAAAVIGADFVGIDLLPLDAGGGYAVLEINGAVDFDDRYSSTTERGVRHATALQLLE